MLLSSLHTGNPNCLHEFQLQVSLPPFSEGELMVAQLSCHSSKAQVISLLLPLQFLYVPVQICSTIIILTRKQKYPNESKHKHILYRAAQMFC
uniref:Putative ovule protein n=1 Tax=Solanum chacoense TaxID=4108 RepID=A0A0V0GI11_SOLCH